MPGASHMGSGKPMVERSTAEIVCMFIILPVVGGVALLSFGVVNVVTNGWQFSVADWFWQVVWLGVLGFGLVAALPAVGWQELRHRRTAQTAGESRQIHSDSGDRIA